MTINCIIFLILCLLSLLIQYVYLCAVTLFNLNIRFKKFITFVVVSLACLETTVLPVNKDNIMYSFLVVTFSSFVTFVCP